MPSLLPIDDEAEIVKQIYRHRLLTADEERDLFLRYKAGDMDAGHEIVRCNMRLAARFAHAYRGRGLPVEDLLQEGAIGLMTAIRKFNPARGLRFTTYATYWVYQAITRAIAEKARAIRLPVHVNEQLSKMTRAERALTHELGRSPTKEEHARALGVSLSKLITLYRQMQQAESLDAPLPTAAFSDNPENYTVGSVVADPDQNVEDQADVTLTREAVRAALACLGERERCVIELRYGLSGEEPLALHAIGQRFGLTRERIRQIEVDAMRHLRTGSGSLYLQGLLDGVTIGHSDDEDELEVAA